MKKIQRNRKTHYTFIPRKLPVLPLRWSQHVPPKVGTVLSQYLVSHPRTDQFLMSLLARTLNLTLKNVVQMRSQEGTLNTETDEEGKPTISMANVKNIKKIVTNTCKRPVSPIRIKKQTVQLSTVSHHINDVMSIINTLASVLCQLKLYSSEGYIHSMGRWPSIGIVWSTSSNNCKARCKCTYKQEEINILKQQVSYNIPLQPFS